MTSNADKIVGTTAMTMQRANTSESTLNYFDTYNPGTPFDKAMDALLILALITSFYLVTSLSYYEWTIQRSNHRTDTRGASRKSKSKIGVGLRVLCILSAIFCLLRCANDIAYYKAQAMSDIPCSVLKNLGTSWLIEVDTTVYLFLWLRHRALYQNRSIRLPSNVFITIASSAAIILIVSLFLSMNIVILGWRRYAYDPENAECIKTNRLANEVNKYLFLAGSSTLHIVLVSLYVYPLMRQVFKMHGPVNKKSTLPAPSNKTPAVQSSDSTKGSKNLMQVVVRCVILSLVCVVTDALTIVLSTFAIRATKARHFTYNINVIINTVAIVLSLTDWKRMLFPYLGLLRQEYKRKGSQPDVTDSTTLRSKQRVDNKVAV